MDAKNALDYELHHPLEPEIKDPPKTPNFAALEADLKRGPIVPPDKAKDVVAGGESYEHH